MVFTGGGAVTPVCHLERRPWFSMLQEILTHQCCEAVISVHYSIASAETKMCHLYRWLFIMRTLLGSVSRGGTASGDASPGRNGLSSPRDSF